MSLMLSVFSMRICQSHLLIDLCTGLEAGVRQLSSPDFYKFINCVLKEVDDESPWLAIIIDFFEDTEDDISTSTVNELFRWWNRQVLYLSMTETWWSNGAVSPQQRFSSHRSSSWYRCFTQDIEVISEEASGISPCKAGQWLGYKYF